MRLMLLLTCIVIVGCNSRGMIIDTDGTTLSATPENARIVHQNRLAERIADAHGEQARVHIDRDPQPHRRDDNGFGYAAAVVTVTTATALDETASETCYAYLRPLYHGPLSRFRDEMSLRFVVDAEAFAKPAEKAEPTKITIRGPGESEQDALPANVLARYRIEAGDTLAAISSVFYGSPQHWHAIVAANPGLDPAALPIGSEIMIPRIEP